MKCVSVFVCDRQSYCKPCCFMTTDKEAAKAHEAAHLNLTVEEYDHWLELHDTAVAAGRALACGSNENTRAAFDAAIDKISKFSHAHPALETENEPFVF